MEQIFETGTIAYEGKDSQTPLAFRFYDRDRMVGDKPMKDHLRFSMSYWHTMTGGGDDPFGSATMQRQWDGTADPMALSRKRADAAFEFMTKLGLDYFCFHDVDVSPESDDLARREDNLDRMADVLEEKMAQTGIRLLWGTTNAFSHPRFVHGASTSCNADVFAYAAAQVKKAMDVTHRLGGENYVFWGGREGYETLLNTDTALELDNLGRFLTMAAEYKEKIGFKGQLLIEPKPKEPTKHQYDFDTATVIGFLRKYGLEDHFKINIEANHATLAGHSFEHELNMARINGMLGSIDANQGDPQLGWDTDQFPSDLYMAVAAMIEVLKNGGIAPGGLNFDAKLRRPSMKPDDLFHGYVLGMDTYARALEIAHRILEDGVFEEFVARRYRSWTEGIGRQIRDGAVGFEELAAYARTNPALDQESGRQEYLEGILNRYI